jgi:hypothetical protein
MICFAVPLHRGEPMIYFVDPFCSENMSYFNCYVWLFAVCLVYFSYSQCDALYVQLFTVQYNFINTSFNNTNMNDYICLLLSLL